VIFERLLSLSGQPNVLPVILEDDDPPTIAGTPDTIASPEGMATPDIDGSGSISSPTEIRPTINSFKPEDVSLTKLKNSYSSSEKSFGLQSQVSGETPYKIGDVVRALLSDHINLVEGLARYVRQYRLELNHKGLGAWIRLSNEKNLYVLTALFYLWLEHLRVPLLGSEELTTVVLYASDPQTTLRKLPLEVAYTVDYTLHFVANLNPGEHELEGILRRIAAALTQRIVPSTQHVKVHLGFHTQNAEKGKLVVLFVVKFVIEIALGLLSGKARKVSEGTLSKLMSVLHGIVAQKKAGLFEPVQVKVTSPSLVETST